VIGEVDILGWNGSGDFATGSAYNPSQADSAIHLSKSDDPNPWVNLLWKHL
jgi:hypothetical protein